VAGGAEATVVWARAAPAQSESRLAKSETFKLCNGIMTCLDGFDVYDADFRSRRSSVPQA